MLTGQLYFATFRRPGDLGGLVTGGRCELATRDGPIPQSNTNCPDEQRSSGDSHAELKRLADLKGETQTGSDSPKMDIKNNPEVHSMNRYRSVCST